MSVSQYQQENCPSLLPLNLSGECLKTRDHSLLDLFLGIPICRNIHSTESSPRKKLALNYMFAFDTLICKMKRKTDLPSYNTAHRMTNEYYWTVSLLVNVRMVVRELGYTFNLYLGQPSNTAYTYEQVVSPLAHARKVRSICELRAVTKSHYSSVVEWLRGWKKVA